ncbi:MAG: carotenoid biosynthesis protein [Nitrosopumilaceae archaeon]|nr:carotenoid biosynthesis protein [Nitrosopumilaceae archaeon]NIU00951.1 carotenoid biosynthesis protein [Nitrosopumilaceae archaeon]NIU87409.1 carotenoid biosynthesis protein [Nitrosopumilaceae archaeon]NIV65931.1 carotenoid biosynthesis protein [Nitrosopumilaceae archaeon]NIX61553.1 carotenoid biosynthesis protein [Nitrosopumilaceae archaeon]
MAQNKTPFYISIIFLALFIYAAIIFPLLDDFVRLAEIPGGVGTKTVFMLFFSLSHAWYLIGWRKTLIFFALTSGISWGYEETGVETGLIYGEYHYTDYLGQKLGHVPLIIPLAWFMMIYPSYLIANLIFSGKPLLKQDKVLQIILTSLLSATVMTAWDFVVDPYLSGPTVNAWVWEKDGAYFGIPIHNFFGWILTTFSVYFAFRIFESKTEEIKTGFGDFVVILPVAAYGLMLIANLIPGEPPELRLIGPVIMGIPILLALIRHIQKSKLVV